ncbi:MAG: hypothetical protein AAFR79_08475, partial [Pseudomonadota bacterium]
MMRKASAFFSVDGESTKARLHATRAPLHDVLAARLSFSPSWFHAWRAAAPQLAARQAARGELAFRIRKIFEKIKGRYGAPRIQA